MGDADMESVLTVLGQLQKTVEKLDKKMDALTDRVTTLERNSAQPSIETPGGSGSDHTQRPPAQQPIDRFRPEEIGYFEGNDVQAFVDRVRTVALAKTPRLILNNISTLLRGVPLKWYLYELQEVTKFALINAPSVEPFCEALKARFAPEAPELVAKLHQMTYTRKDAASKRDATEFVQDVIQITSQLGWDLQMSLQTAHQQFEPQLYVFLSPPVGSDVNSFMRDIQRNQAAWFQMYAHFTPRNTHFDRGPPPRAPSSYDRNYTQSTYNSGRRPWQNNQQGTQQSHQQGLPQPYAPARPRLTIGDKPHAYHTDGFDAYNEQYDDYD